MFWRRTQREDGAGDEGCDPYEAAREEMIEHQLRNRGVVMHGVLEAMREIPRHLFVAHALADRAYADEALPSIEGQTISQPFMVGIMTQELRLKAGQRVLELGTGTGYQTAILAAMVRPGGRVYTVERMARLAEFAKRRLGAMGIENVTYRVGDGSAGWREEGPFDRILVTAGAPRVPGPLVEQLTEGGILVVPVGDGDSQMLMRVEKRGGRVEETELFGCRFVPLVGEYGWKEGENDPGD